MSNLNLIRGRRGPSDRYRRRPWAGPEEEGDMHMHACSMMHACMHAPGQSIDLPQLYRRPWTAPLEGRRSKA